MLFPDVIPFFTVLHCSSIHSSFAASSSSRLPCSLFCIQVLLQCLRTSVVSTVVFGRTDPEARLGPRAESSSSVSQGPLQLLRIALLVDFPRGCPHRSQLGEFLKTTVDVRQGCLLSRILFNLFLETSCMRHSMTTTHPSSLIAGPYAYDSPKTSIFLVAAKVNFKTSPTDS